MPRFFVPQKSSVHRAACFALYRALHRCIRKIQLDGVSGPTFQCEAKRRLANTFRWNGRLQQHAAVVNALRKGYNGLKYLQNAAVREQKAFSLGTEILENLKSRPPRKLTASKKSQDVSSRSPTTKPINNGPQGPPSIFERPYPTLSGRRSVPHLINAGSFPFLRYRKPQPTIISCIIASQQKARERRWDRYYDMQYLEYLGKLEDDWDRTLERFCGLSQDVLGRRTSWAAAPLREIREISATNVRHMDKEKLMIEKLRLIRDEEQALADQEESVRRDEKQRQRIARHWARNNSEAQIRNDSTIELAATTG